MIRPSSLSAARTFRAVVLAMPYSRWIITMLGTISPGASSPDKIFRRRMSLTCRLVEQDHPVYTGVPATVPSQSQSAHYESPAALTASSPAFTPGFAAIAACRRWLLMAVRGRLRGRLLAVVQALLVAGL